jgi:RNA polymerase sigma-70 factor (family 1)
LPDRPDISYDDAYSLSRIKEGDEYFFNLIFEKYRNQLFSYLFKVTKSREVSEEYVLDIFLKLWHGREAITEIRHFEGFLFKVAHNKAVDFFRAASRNKELQQSIWDSIHHMSASEEADASILFKSTHELIREAIEQLSPQRKKVFELRHHDDLSYAQISAVMHLSPNTVRNHLAASIQFIRDYLDKHSVQMIMLSSAYFDLWKDLK